MEHRTTRFFLVIFVLFTLFTQGHVAKRLLIKEFDRTEKCLTSARGPPTPSYTAVSFTGGVGVFCFVFRSRFGVVVSQVASDDATP